MGPSYPVWTQWKPARLSGRYTANSSSSPSTKVGKVMPISTPVVEIRSIRDRARVALRMPAEMPTMSQSTTPPTSTDSVGGRSCLRMVLTEVPVKYEVPRLKCRAGPGNASTGR